MMQRHGLALLLFAVAASGCRSTANVELLERELRLQEDRIFELENELEDSQRKLEAYQRGFSAPVRTSPPATGPTGGHGAPSEDFKESEPTPPTVELPSASSERAPPSLGVPELSPPDPRRPDGENLDLRQGEPPRSNPAARFPAESETVTPDGPLEPPQSNRPVGGDAQRITLNRFLTGGRDRDSAPGDEGLTVVVEPRDAQGRLIEPRGEISIVALDPAKTGEAARVGRWNFSAEEVASRFRRTPVAAGLFFDLDWPGPPPENRQLELFVRLTKPSGQTLVTDRSIAINAMPPGERATEVARSRPASSQAVSQPRRTVPPSQEPDTATMWRKASARVSSSGSRAQWSPAQPVVTDRAAQRPLQR